MPGIPSRPNVDQRRGPDHRGGKNKKRRKGGLPEYMKVRHQPNYV